MRLRCAGFGFIACLATCASAQQSPAAAPGTPALPEPALSANTASGAARASGRIQLDVLVTDKSGKPATGLNANDFKLLDNGQPEKILSFAEFDGTQPTAEPPVTVVLVLDTVNIGADGVDYARQQLDRFLRQNGGHLSQPVSIFLLSDTKLLELSRPSHDGNDLASIVDRQKSTIRTIGIPQGANGAIERFQLSVRAISSIADDEQREPGRKLLIWIGNGWPRLDGLAFSQITLEDEKRYFAALVSLSTRIRQARMALYTTPWNLGDLNTDRYKGYLKGVKTSRDAHPPDLGLQVLAVHSGGRVLVPSSDLAAQIANCVADAGPFYTLSFDPPRADHADEYHDLKLEVDKPGLTARTSSGYYNEP
jgi:VWFA-related protein